MSFNEEIRVAKINALKKERAAQNARIKKELMLLGEDAPKKRKPQTPPRREISVKMHESNILDEIAQMRREIAELRGAFMMFAHQNCCSKPETWARVPYNTATQPQAPIIVQQNTQQDNAGGDDLDAILAKIGAKIDGLADGLK